MRTRLGVAHEKDLKAFFEEMLRNIRHQIRLLLQQLACDLFVCEAQHQ